MKENYLDCWTPGGRKGNGQSQKNLVQTPHSGGNGELTLYFHVNKNGWIPFKEKWEKKPSWGIH